MVQRYRRRYLSLINLIKFGDFQEGPDTVWEIQNSYQHQTTRINKWIQNNGSTIWKPRTTFVSNFVINDPPNGDSCGPSSGPVFVLGREPWVKSQFCRRPELPGEAQNPSRREQADKGSSCICKAAPVPNRQAAVCNGCPQSPPHAVHMRQKDYFLPKIPLELVRLTVQGLCSRCRGAGQV